MSKITKNTLSVKYSKLILSLFIVTISAPCFGYTNAVEAYKQLQQKIEQTISSNRLFYSCESDFRTPSLYYQGKQSNKWYLINVAAVTTPQANANLINEITTATIDNVYFQAAYKIEYLVQERSYLFPGFATAKTQAITYIFSASLNGRPQIQHSYKRGIFSYYTFLAKGSCEVLNQKQFEATFEKLLSP